MSKLILTSHTLETISDRKVSGDVNIDIYFFLHKKN